MFRKFFYLLVLSGIILSPFCAFADFDRAVKLYNENQYEKALELFQAEADNYKLTGELAFNIGNCFFKLEKYGHAFQWYKKAEKYLFFDPDLKFNMDVCLTKLSINDKNQTFLTDKIFFLRTYFSEFFINILSLVFFVFFLFLLLFRKKFFGFKIITCILSIYLILSCINYFLEYNICKKGIIVSGAKVFSAHSEKASTLFSLSEGSMVKIYKCEDGFCKILTIEGKPGWVNKSRLGVI
jgi:tetratricopeptide (TPR) repeat protein